MTDNDRLNLLFDLRRYKDAAEAAREAIAKNPDWGAGYTHLARALINLNQKDEAIAAAREGVRKEPSDAWAAGTLACALNWFGHTKEALEYAEQAMRLDPRYPWAYAMLANILFNLNRFKESLARSVEGLRFDPLHESLFRWKGWAEHKLSEHDDALATANEGLKHHPNSHLLMNLIGCIKWTLAQKKWGLARLRLHRDADVALRDSMRLDPGQPAYRDNLRGNAVSCRQHVAFVCLPVLMILGLVVPILVLCANVLHDIDPGLTTGIGCGALLIAFVVCGVAPISMAAYAAPLSRWNIPEVPLTDKERWQGRAGLYLIAFFFLLPYLLAAALLFG